MIEYTEAIQSLPDSDGQCSIALIGIREVDDGLYVDLAVSIPERTDSAKPESTFGLSRRLADAMQDTPCLRAVDDVQTELGISPPTLIPWDFGYDEPRLLALSAKFEPGYFTVAPTLIDSRPAWLLQTVMYRRNASLAGRRMALDPRTVARVGRHVRPPVSLQVIAREVEVLPMETSSR